MLFQVARKLKDLFGNSYTLENVYVVDCRTQQQVEESFDHLLKDGWLITPISICALDEALRDAAIRFKKK